MCSKEDCPYSQEVDRMGKTLYGNGREGLVVTVAKIQTGNKVIIGICTATFIAMIIKFFV